MAVYGATVYKVKGFKLIMATQRIRRNSKGIPTSYDVVVRRVAPERLKVGWILGQDVLIDPTASNVNRSKPSIRVSSGYSQYMRDNELCLWINSSDNQHYRDEVYNMGQEVYEMAQKLVLGLCQMHSNNTLTIDDVWENVDGSQADT
jgi:hypothetical protein